MAGLYIHIPFCKQACHYCDFHFRTNLDQKATLVAALGQELARQSDYLPTDTLETIYFGGGTPSLLTEAELLPLFDDIHRHFRVTPDAEITLEANPDDLTPEKIQVLRRSPVNRLSIGIQSFHAPHLRYLNRAHNDQEAYSCVQRAQDAGFSNISIDLIYAIPHPDHAVWASDLKRMNQLNVPHVSAYCLTIEPQTAFGNWVRRGKITPVDEAFSVTQFQMLMDFMTEYGYEQYEISNFARPGKYSRHNTSYWQNRPYLGIGPSAHSFNGITRQSNVASNAQYVRAIQSGMIPSTVEKLSVTERVNECIMTGLRTQWGCDLAAIRAWSGMDVMQHNRQLIDQYRKRGLLILEADTLRLTQAGKFLADQIASDLFIV